jgi:hypothetical protein
VSSRSLDEVAEENGREILATRKPVSPSEEIEGEIPRILKKVEKKEEQK